MSSKQHQQEEEQKIQQFKYSKRVVLKSILEREDRGLGLVRQRVVVGGWVKSKKERKEKAHAKVDREHDEGYNVSCWEAIFSRISILWFIGRALVRRVGGFWGREEDSVPTFSYLRINDGSCAAHLQIMMNSSMSLVDQVISIGSSIIVEGVLEQPNRQGKHAVELKVENIIHVGVADIERYPLAKTKLSLDFLRAYPHLRPRTTTIASITRIRNTLSYATHTFFANNGFIYVHMPIITTTDIGASSNMFRVTTLLQKFDDTEQLNEANDREIISLEVIKASIKEKSNIIEELNRSGSNKEALVAAIQDLQKANELALQLEEKHNVSSSKVGGLDFSKDFFSRPAYLSVSAGLYLESYACALSSVYTFGPIFRAEYSQSRKQLAEMWMVEVELAFAELEDAMNCAEDFLKSAIQSVLHDCRDDMKFISKQIDKGCIDHLQSVCSNAFVRITYKEALEVLKQANDRTFETKLDWGTNLSEEHESYLVDEVYKQPIIVYDYPKEVKPFYVHIKEDGKTASAFDIFAPNVGVLVRGSRKEENIDKMSKRMKELSLPQEHYDWYLDLRRHGTIKHSGFSIGFENVVMFTTGLDDIRDVIPFPRFHGSANT